MLITDILVHSNRRRTDAYCQGQKSECVGGWSRLFSLLGHSSSGSIQMPKSSIVWPHSNNTIVPSGSDCATLCNAGVTTVRMYVLVCLCSVLVALCVSIIIWTCVCVPVFVALCVCIPAACVCISRSRGFALLATTMHPVIEMQKGKRSLNLTLFSGTAPCEVAQKLLLREGKLFKHLYVESFLLWII